MEATGREKAAALLYPLPLQLTLTRHPISFRDTGSFSVGPPTTQASSDGPDIEGPSGVGLMVPEPWGQGERQLRLPWNDAHGRGSLPLKEVSVRCYFSNQLLHIPRSQTGLTWGERPEPQPSSLWAQPLSLCQPKRE